MVLPVRIELTTSALPRMRSTTELRQHVGRTRAYGQSLASLSTRLAGMHAKRRSRQMAGQDREKAERLAAALRENLRKRKARARDAADSAKSSKD